MLAPTDVPPVNARAALVFLFLGNIMIGSGVLAPAALINAMTADLKVSPVAIGALTGWGAVVLCIGAPAFGFLTNQDRPPRAARRLPRALCCWATPPRPSRRTTARSSSRAS
jgi:hypothetical protein